MRKTNKNKKHGQKLCSIDIFVFIHNPLNTLYLDDERLPV